MASAPIVHLHDVHRFADLALQYLGEQSAEAFRADLKTQHATAYCLLSLVRTLARIEVENPHFLSSKISADINWARLIEVDIFLARGFDRLDADALHCTLIEDIPDVLAVTQTYIAQHQIQK